MLKPGEIIRISQKLRHPFGRDKSKFQIITFGVYGTKAIVALPHQLPHDRLRVARSLNKEAWWSQYYGCWKTTEEGAPARVKYVTTVQQKGLDGSDVVRGSNRWWACPAVGQGSYAR